MKTAGQSSLPNYEIVAFLGLFMSMFIAIYAAFRGELTELWPKGPRRMLLRSSLDVGNNFFIVIALRHLSLTLFYILVFTSPMLVTILGRLFLNERLGWRKMTAILVGFLGVVVAVNPFRPSGSGDWIGYAACAICVGCFSVAVVWSRVISQTERPESMVFFSGLVTAIAGLIGMLTHAEPVSGRVMVALLLMGLLCALGNICIFVALRYAAAAATVSQYHYTQLLSGSIVAYVFFHEKPTAFTAAGAVLIVGSGLYIAVLVSRAGSSTSTDKAALAEPGRANSRL